MRAIRKGLAPMSRYRCFITATPGTVTWSYVDATRTTPTAERRPVQCRTSGSEKRYDKLFGGGDRRVGRWTGTSNLSRGLRIHKKKHIIYIHIHNTPTNIYRERVIVERKKRRKRKQSRYVPRTWMWIIHTEPTRMGGSRRRRRLSRLPGKRTLGCLGNERPLAAGFTCE